MLHFADKEMAKSYRRQKTIFYSRSLPVILAMAVCLSLALEITYRGQGVGDIDITTSIINAVTVVLLLVLTVAVRFRFEAAYFVNPALTAFTYFYLSMVDYDGVNVSVYYSVIVGITVSYFLLVVFNEMWLLSVLTYAPLLAWFMWKTGRDMIGGEEASELTVRCLFCIFIYALIAYKTELLNKQAFLGKESSEKAFYRWLRIFETFPEGLALIRKG